jgi:hypothetical protein
VVRGAKAGIEFGLLCSAQVGAHGVGPGDLPDVKPRVGLHFCLDSPEGYAKQG